MKTNRSMPSVNKIKEYWACRLSNNVWRKADNPYEVLTKDFCWACGAVGFPLQRAHILSRAGHPDPKSTDKVENLHMLCSVCHTDSEEIDGLKYFRWFRKRKFGAGPDKFVKGVLNILQQKHNLNKLDELIRLFGTISEFEKAQNLSKMRAARNRKRKKVGKCEGRKGYHETNPTLVREAKRLRRKSPKTGKRRSLNSVSQELFALGFKTSKGNAFSASQVQRLIE